MTTSPGATLAFSQTMMRTLTVSHFPLSRFPCTSSTLPQSTRPTGRHLLLPSHLNPSPPPTSTQSSVKTKLAAPSPEAPGTAASYRTSHQSPMSPTSQSWKEIHRAKVAEWDSRTSTVSNRYDAGLDRTVCGIIWKYYRSLGNQFRL